MMDQKNPAEEKLEKMWPVEAFQLSEEPIAVTVFEKISELEEWHEIFAGHCVPYYYNDGKSNENQLQLTIIFDKEYYSIPIQLITQMIRNDALGSKRLALSFETVEGCEETLGFISAAKAEEFEDLSKFEFDSEMQENLDDQSYWIQEQMREPQAPPINTITFPDAPTIENLAAVEDAIQRTSCFYDMRDTLIKILFEHSYIPILLDIFRVCEENNQTHELATIFRIFKKILLLNQQELIHVITEKNHFIRFLGVLEHDPAFPDLQLNYRLIFASCNNFKQVVPINNEEFLELIHQTFRAQYLKNIVLARFIDDDCLGSVMVFIRLNHIKILKMIEMNPEMIEILKTLIVSRSIDYNTLLELLKFLKELLTISRSVGMSREVSIFQQGMIGQVFRLINRVFDIQDNQQAKQIAMEILLIFIHWDSGAVKAFMMADRKDEGDLLKQLIDLFLNEEASSSLRWQIVTIFKIILDTVVYVAPTASIAANPSLPPEAAHAMAVALAQKAVDRFLAFFYPDYVCRLLRPLIDLDKILFRQVSMEKKSKAESAFATGNPSEIFWKINPKDIKEFSEAQAEILFHLGELLCNFITQHNYRIKYLVLRNLLFQNTLLLLKCPEKFLKLVGLRVFRTTLAAPDEFYQRFFIQQRFFAPIIATYKSLGGGKTDNMVTSAILDIFEYIRTTRVTNQNLIKHLATFHRSDFEVMEPRSVFGGILEIYQKIESGQELTIVQNVLPTIEDLNADFADQPMVDNIMNIGASMNERDDRFNEDWRLIDQDEEDYFSGIEDIEFCYNIDEEGRDFGEELIIENDQRQEDDQEQQQEQEFRPPPMKPIKNEEEEEEEEFPFLNNKASNAKLSSIPNKAANVLGPLKKMKL